MAARLGTTSVSALISGARSQRNSVNAYNDAMALYQFNLSDKTQEDYNKYTDYLKQRQTQETDPMKLLDIQKAMTTAYSGFTSKEIQRASLDIMTGNGSEQDKLNKLGQLYTQAVGIGDDNLAGNLLNQYYTQQLKIDNANQAASTKAATAQETDNYKQLTAAVQKTELGMKTATALLNSGHMTTSEYNAQMSQLAQAKTQIYQQAANGDFGNFSDAHIATIQNDINNWQVHPDNLKYGNPNSAQAQDNTGQYVSFNPNDHTASITNADRTPSGVDPKTGLNTYTDFTTAGNKFIHPANIMNPDGSVNGKTETGEQIQYDPTTGQAFYIEQRPGAPRYGQKIWLTGGKNAQTGATQGAQIPSVAPANLPKINEAPADYSPIHALGAVAHSKLVGDIETAIPHAVGAVGNLFTHGLGSILTSVAASGRARAAAAAQALATAQLQAAAAKAQSTPLNQPLPNNLTLAARSVGNPAARSVLVAPTTPVFLNPTPAQQTANVTNSLNQLFPQYSVPAHPQAPSPTTSGFSLLHPSTWF